MGGGGVVVLWSYPHSSVHSFRWAWWGLSMFLYVCTCTCVCVCVLLVCEMYISVAVVLVGVLGWLLGGRGVSHAALGQ